MQGTAVVVCASLLDEGTWKGDRIKFSWATDLKPREKREVWKAGVSNRRGAIK